MIIAAELCDNCHDSIAIVVLFTNMYSQTFRVGLSDVGSLNLNVL